MGTARRSVPLAEPHRKRKFLRNRRLQTAGVCASQRLARRGPSDRARCAGFGALPTFRLTPIMGQRPGSGRPNHYHPQAPKGGIGGIRRTIRRGRNANSVFRPCKARGFIQFYPQPRPVWPGLCYFASLGLNQRPARASSQIRAPPIFLLTTCLPMC
jgi:hypothetical protein